MVLIAQLATHGTRAPLAQMADQVFLSLVEELRHRGLSHRVVANMFSLPLSTYHDRVRRYSQSNTKQGSLWKEVLVFVEDHQPVIHGRLLYEFHKDSADDINSILNDLVRARLVSKTGAGFDTTYEITSEKSRMASEGEPGEAAASLVWVTIYGNRGITHDRLAELLNMEDDLLDDALDTLMDQNRIMVEEIDGAVGYLCDECVIPFRASVGWEAAVLDHYQAMVKAVCVKLDRGQKLADMGDVVGGSTYKFYVSEDHPMREEVLDQLSRLRETVGDLRTQVTAYNKEHGLESTQMDEVVFYLGQAVTPADTVAE